MYANEDVEKADDRSSFQQDFKTALCRWVDELSPVLKVFSAINFIYPASGSDGKL